MYLNTSAEHHKTYDFVIEYEIIHNDTIDIGKVDKNMTVDLSIDYDTNIKGDYIIDYQFLNSALDKDKK